MASFPGLCKAVGPSEEEDGELDGSLRQMLKAIADERNRLNGRQEISGLGESGSGSGSGRGCASGDEFCVVGARVVCFIVCFCLIVFVYQPGALLSSEGPRGGGTTCPPGGQTSLTTTMFLFGGRETLSAAHVLYLFGFRG